MTEIPLFPLSGVLLPKGRMSLQVFEQRYLDLVRECTREETGFGVVWIRRGAEVAQRGSASPELGDVGCYAHIVDWDQLPNGLLGITIEGRSLFDLHSVSSRANGLQMGEVSWRSVAPAEAPGPGWESLEDVLRSLQTHPHVQRIGLEVDFDNGWELAYALVQLLPLDEALKYELLCLQDLEAVRSELNRLLNQISGED